MFRRKFTKLLVTLVAVVVTATCALSACSQAGTEIRSASQSSHVNEAWFKDFEATVAQGYAGVSVEDPPAGPPAVKDKTVWYISAGEACVGCAQIGSGFKDAAKILGWNLKYVDGKLDPAVVSAAIDQAVAAKADGIAMAIFDCSTIKNALEKAKAAGIPVVSTFSTDCDSPLFTALTTLDGKPAAFGLRAYTSVKTAWAITKSGGNVKAIDIKEDDVQSVVQEEKGFQDAMAKCDSCQTVATIDLTLSTSGNIQALLSAELAKHPEANVVTIPFGGLLPQGARAAIEQAGRQKNNMFVIGAACDGGEIDLMRADWNIVCGGYQQKQNGWMAADFINRLLAGETASKLPTVGIGYQLVDRDHNMPKDGDEWTIPTDYAAAYRAAWAR
jgi:ribose transport system substrate-binding protein